jgi:hypothetical protein
MPRPLSEAALAATYQPKSPAPSLEAVTLDVVIGMAHGRSYAQIAADLEITVGTVQRHVRILRSALGERDRAGIVGAAYRSGLLPIEPQWSTHPMHTIRAASLQATLDVLFLASNAYEDHEIREARELARALINSDHRRQVVPVLPPLPCLDDLFQDEAT